MDSDRPHTHDDARRCHRRDDEIRHRLQAHQDDGQGQGVDPDAPPVAGGQGRSANEFKTQAVITVVIWALLGLLLAGAAIANWIGG